MRHEDQAKLLGEKGVTAVLFKGLDDVESVRKISSEYDRKSFSQNGEYDLPKI